MIYDVTKRIFDIGVSVAVLVVLIVPLCAVALLVRLSLGSPVLFIQARTGRHGRTFALVKFRTMRDAGKSGGAGVSDAERLTSFGRLLRATSVDEMPELWNVLRGEMSLVGPRPLLPEYLSYYTPDQARRHDVLPGLTGWAQVNGRNAQSWNRRFELDVEYVERRSLRLDARILILTAIRVLAGAGIETAPDLPMPRFDDEVKAGRARGVMNGRL